jgi:Ca2+-binding RTX toxin-like protein
MLLLSIPLIEQNANAQKVIDNEILSSDNENNDEKHSKGDNDAEETSNINEFAAKPLVHVSIEGTEINDKIRGGDGNDLMSGEDGKDTLQGHEGDDEIDGGKGEDNIDGGEGDDSLNGGDDNDDIIGGIGDDEIDGGDGKDTLQGHEGDDEIDGGKGEDNIDGGEGDDSLNGGDDNDDIIGGIGDDEIDGGDGSDVVKGGEGKDKLKGGDDADRFTCDQDDKISDYNSLENDLIIGECEYEDKGLIPKPSLEKSPIPADYVGPNRQDNNNLKSIDSSNSEYPNSEDNPFKKFMSKFIDRDVPQLFR